ncbi:MAG: hypothetical protein GXP47_08725 [Acidobacteria bacterium]|nr:hypothetical protein [Acidobacteriota bacterium]
MATRTIRLGERHEPISDLDHDLVELQASLAVARGHRLQPLPQPLAGHRA